MNWLMSWLMKCSIVLLLAVSFAVHMASAGDKDKPGPKCPVGQLSGTSSIRNIGGEENVISSTDNSAGNLAGISIGGPCRGSAGGSSEQKAPLNASEETIVVLPAEGDKPHDFEAGDYSSKQNLHGVKPENYPWALGPTYFVCQKQGCSGFLHRHRKLVARVSAGTVAISFASMLGLLRAYMGSPHPFFPLNLLFIAGEIFPAALGSAGVWGLCSTRQSGNGKAVFRLYQCNHEECLKVPHLEPDTAISEHLRCPGNSKYLLRHPVMISGYEHPLSVEYVMQCIRNEKPFPQCSSAPVEWSRVIDWRNLSFDQQQRVYAVYNESQKWLRENTTEDWEKAASINDTPEEVALLLIEPVI